MIKRLPRFAETKFAVMCAEFGALCHKSEEDENGWDYLVEFPLEVSGAPADAVRTIPHAFIQVKSTVTNRTSCRVKLSNALKAAESTQPWFVLLMTVDSK